MLGATTHRLHRCPHVTIARNQVPAGLHKIASLDLATGVDRFWNTFAAIRQRLRPNKVSVAFYDGMGAAEFSRFFGIKGCMNSAKNHIRAPLSRQLPDFVTPQCVCSMNANSDGIPRLNSLRVHPK